MNTETLRTLLRRADGFASVYVDASADVPDPRRTTAIRHRDAADELLRQGASEADAAAVRDALDDGTGVASPSVRYLLVQGGRVEVDEVFPGPLLAAERVEFAPIPDVAPLLFHRPAPVRVLVVQTSRDGGEIALVTLGVAGDTDEGRVQGRTDSLNKVRAGGWSNPRYQRHTEEIWKQTQQELGDRVDALVIEHRPRALVVAGDVRAVQLLRNSLAEASADLLTIVPTDTDADGADDSALDTGIESALAEALAEERGVVLDRLRPRSEGEDREIALGIGEVVTALRAAQADTVLIAKGIDHDADGTAGRLLVALDGEPWLATDPTIDGNASATRVRASSALARAAVLTDARVLPVDDGVLPDNTATAALLRWPTGPA